MSKDSNGYGKRPDGTKKSSGFLGEMKRPDGNVSTEISIGIEIDGKERDIPLMVPGLDKMELQWLLNTPVENIAKEVPQNILNKAVRHAKDRIKAGKSPFYEDGE